MVPLETKTSYLSGINENPKLQAFRGLIYHESVKAPARDLKEVDSIYFSVLHSVAILDKNEFDKSYQVLSKRKVTSESPAPFIHDDALIFALIVGVCIFGYDKEWIRQIVNNRSASDTTVTFKSLIAQDYFNKLNLPQIIIPFLHLCKISSPSESYINETYRLIAGNESLMESKSDFLILLSINTYDWIITSKNTEDGALDRLKTFEKSFKKRVRIITWFAYNGALLAVTYLIWRGLTAFPEIKDKFSDVATIVGFIGIQVLGNTLSGLRVRLEALIQRLLGY